MHVLLTGASGYLGRAVWARLQQKYRVIALSFSQSAPGLQAVDLRDAQALTAVMCSTQPEVVIHCAAYRDPDYCEQHPDEAYRLNVEPVKTLMAALPKHGRMLYISTDYVFDGQSPPYAEAAERRPINQYGATKRDAEDVVAARSSSIVLRVPLLVGCGPTFAQSGFIAKAIQTLETQPVSTWDHVINRYPTAITDVAAAIEFLLGREDAAGPYHFTQAVGGTQYEWVCRLAEILGRSTAAIRPAHSLTMRPATRPRDSHLANHRLAELGFERNTPFESVAREILATRRNI